VMVMRVGHFAAVSLSILVPAAAAGNGHNGYILCKAATL